MSGLPIDVLPSVLSADFGYLADDLASCAQAGAKRLHLDVMDGHFVPNVSFGPFIVEWIDKNSDLYLDVHLMMTNPMDYIDMFKDAGADSIIVHVEAIGQRKMDAAIAQIRETGVDVGLSFNPDTDPRLWFKYFDKIDLVMFMTVYPGFGGQSFIPEVRDFIQATRKEFPHLPIQVDGGINRKTIDMVVEDGANRLVCGSAFFGDENREEFITWAERER